MFQTMNVILSTNIRPSVLGTLDEVAEEIVADTTRGGIRAMVDAELGVNVIMNFQNEIRDL